MTRFWRRIPIALAVAAGILVLLDYFVSDPTIDALGQTLANWVTILAAAALVLGIINLVRVHVGRVAVSSSNWPYSLALLGGLLLTLLLGLAPGSGGANDPALSWVFAYIYQALAAAIVSLLAFYIASAAYRSLRLGTPEGAALLIAGVIVLLGQIPLVAEVWDVLPQARTWLLAVIGTAGMRGIIIAAALGAILTGLRVLLGLDHQYLNGDLDKDNEEA